MIARRGLLTVVVAAALALSRCGTKAGDRQPEPAASVTAAGGYDFTVAALDGATFDGRSLAGKPAVLCYAWRS
jgi:cytochrome oxidase Cu insertion factor (SCO1/SenC/PrrC family)